uniref:Uncharacterized protein n=1 Tax=Rhizophora mucronata TaxID=61149 RepID=A0A2P2PYI0_RHIMU
MSFIKLTHTNRMQIQIEILLITCL